MGIGVVDRKLLWGKSGGQCAFPSCNQSLTEVVEQSESGLAVDIVIGEEAHIVAHEDDGPRGDPAMPIPERDSYPNLILLCPTHHTQVDKDHGIYYTVEQLREMKRYHEAAVHESRNNTSGRDQADRRRSEALLEAASSSRGRLIARWMAAGVSADMAETLADDEAVGAPVRLNEQVPDVGMVFIEGDFGSGKSVAVERMHQEHIQRALEDSNAPSPVYISAKSLGEGSLLEIVENKVQALTDDHHLGVKIILDGLDEPSVGRALEILNEARAFAFSRPEDLILITTRPGLPVNSAETLIKCPPLDDGEAASLVERLGGHRALLWSESPAIRDMLRLPLFTIIATLRQQSGIEMPRSRGTFLESLAEAALDRTPAAHGEASAALKKLARLAVEFGGLVPAAELEDNAAVRICVETRVVTRVGRSLQFVLPVVEQFFAAQVLLEGDTANLIDVTDLVTLDKWRYPLIMALTIASWNKSKAILGAIVAHHPGYVAWLVDGSIPQHGQSEVALPGHVECARRLRDAIDMWRSSFDQIDPMIKLTDGRGNVRTIGAYAVGSNLTVAFKVGAVSSTGVERLPDEFNFFTGMAADGTRWGPRRTGQVPADFPAWPWRWALSWLSGGFESLLKGQLLQPVGCLPFDSEREWWMARAIVRQSSIVLHQPIEKSALLRAGSEIIARMGPGQEFINLGGVRSAIVSRLELVNLLDRLSLENGSSDAGFLIRPYPAPDNVPGVGNTIDRLYSDGQVRDLVEQVYQNALTIYDALVDSFFARLRPMLGLGCILPVRIDGVLSRPEGNGFVSVFSHFMEPIAERDSQGVTVRLGGKEPGPLLSSEGAVVASDDGVWQRIKRYHAESEGWARPRSGWTVVSVFGNRPATHQAYRWLWEDLKALHLVSRA